MNLLELGSKAQTIELLEILGLVTLASVLIVTFYSLSVRRISDLAEASLERHFETKTSLLTIEIFYTEITGTNRTLAHLIGDMISSKRELINYGKGLGILNVSETIEFFLNSYLDNWHLDIGFKKFGKPIPTEKRIYSAEIYFPLSTPKGRFHKTYLYWW